jgi:thymidylate synthase ThyX
VPPEIDEVGAGDDWHDVMAASAGLAGDLLEGIGEDVASYAVAMAYRVRFYMDMNAREAMHLIELRSTPQGHPAYRRVAQRMHTLIAEQAGHRAIAAAMSFADHSGGDTGRLEAERRTEARRAADGPSA